MTHRNVDNARSGTTPPVIMATRVSFVMCTSLGMYTLDPRAASTPGCRRPWPQRVTQQGLHSRTTPTPPLNGSPRVEPLPPSPALGKDTPTDRRRYPTSRRATREGFDAHGSAGCMVRPAGPRRRGWEAFSYLYVNHLAPRGQEPRSTPVPRVHAAGKRQEDVKLGHHLEHAARTGHGSLPPSAGNSCSRSARRVSRANGSVLLSRQTCPSRPTKQSNRSARPTLAAEVKTGE